MTHWIFNEPGSIPGIPGTFSNCRVDIDDDGNLTQTPLVVLEAVPPASEQAPATPLAEPVQPPAEQASSTAGEVISDIVQEQAVPPVPYFTGG